MTDTIFALSSGRPPAAIGIVRISGSRADAALAALISGALPAARRAVVRTLRSSGVALDDALVLRFPGPASATGEDLVELHLHGGRATIEAVCAALADQPGLRVAEPGEFTRRAFANGRIDLAQAEGLSDLLRAETETQRRAALAIAEGGLSRVVENLRRDLLDAAARVEAALDFDDEDDVIPWPSRGTVLEELVRGIKAHLRAPPAERLHDGVTVAVGGPPNAGKSSLINALSSREAAIVSPIAGTTRDVIEVPLRVRGMAFRLIDTAGLHSASNDPIERIGIERAMISIATSDILVWMGDDDSQPDHPCVIRVHGKADIVPDAGDRLPVSAMTGDGVSSLVDQLVARAHALLPAGDAFALNARQRHCLQDVAEALQAAARTDDLLIVAEHLRLSRLALDRITGRADVEDMLDALFGTFCIGK